MGQTVVSVFAKNDLTALQEPLEVGDKIEIQRPGCSYCAIYFEQQQKMGQTVVSVFAENALTALQEPLEVGDKIEIARRTYSHCAIYIGNGDIIHRTCDEQDETSPTSCFLCCFGVEAHKAVVKKDCLIRVAGTSKIIKSNTKDEMYKPFDADKIKARAESKLGTRGYNIIWKNCEHFANWCRYGKEESDQVTFFLGHASTSVRRLGSVGALVLLALRNDCVMLKKKKTEGFGEEDQPNEIIPGSSVAISEALDRVCLPILSATDPDYYLNGTRVYHDLSNRNWKKGVDLITGGKSSFDAMLSNPGSTYINSYSGLGNLSYINLNNQAYCPLPVDVCYPKLGRDELQISMRPR